MRIGVLLTGFDGGGAQRRLLTLATGFLARGHSVELVVGDVRGPFRELAPAAAAVVSLEGAAHGIPGVARRKSLRMLAALPALVRYLRSGSVDVLLAGSTPVNLAVLAAREIAGSSAPIVISLNVPLSRSTAQRRRPLLARLVRRLYPRAAAVIALSAFVADDAVRFAGICVDRVTTIPNPIALDEIRRHASEPVSHAWANDDDVPLVLAVGKLKPQKDFATLLRAFREVCAARPARLLVLGTGEQLHALERLARSLGIAADLEFPGFVANPFPYMRRASVFVSSSRWEGFSNVLGEALACGCPIVATDCPGGVADLLGGGRFGTLVATGDHHAMAQAVLRTLESAPDRESLRGRAAEYSIERASDAYLAVLSRCGARATEGPAMTGGRV